MVPAAPVEVVARSTSHPRVEVLDVRNMDEFAAGHIHGARFIPLPQLPARVHELRRDDRIFVVCESGSRATEATRYLATRGFDVHPMSGGMSAWRSAGLPTVPGTR